MKKIWIYLLFALLVIFNINLILNVNKQKVDIQKANETQQVLKNSTLQLLEKETWQMYCNNHFLITHNAEFNNLENDSAIIVARLFENECNDCTDSLLVVMKKAINIINANKFIVLGDFLNKLRIKALLNNHDIENVKIFLLPKGGSNTPIENVNKNYLFVLTKDKKVNDLFIFDRELPHRSAMYFGMLKKKYFSKSTEDFVLKKEDGDNMQYNHSK